MYTLPAADDLEFAALLRRCLWQAPRPSQGHPDRASIRQIGSDRVIRYLYHAVYHVTITPSGSYNMLWNEQDVGDSIGDTTGDEYRVNMTWHEHITGRVGETQHWSWPLSFKNVTKNRMQIHDMHYHLTVNANGEVTILRDEVGVRCAGPDK